VITQNFDAPGGECSGGIGHWLTLIREILQINYSKMLTKSRLKY
jgi:hypothetical protein